MIVRSSLVPTRRALAALAVVACLPVAVVPVLAQGGPPAKVDFMGGANSPISNTVGIPAGAAFVWTSGTGPTVVDRNGQGAHARYGDTKTQSISVLTNIEARLKERGLSMKDVVYLRAYLVPDPEKGGTVDSQGWNEAYGQFFNTATNPTKPARSTVGVAALVVSGWLVEVEAFAVYPPM